MPQNRRLLLESLEDRRMLSLSPNGDGSTPGGSDDIQRLTYPQCPAATVATDADGDFVLVWTADEGNGNGLDVFSQRFDASATPLADAAAVNSTTAGSQMFPAVAMDADGDFVVTWSSLSQDGSGYGVFAQRYSSAGTVLGGEFLVNTATAGNQNFSAVAMDADGDFVIVWTSQDQDGSGTGVFAQRYDSGGNPLGSEFQVNATSEGNQRYPAVDMDSAGEFTITWTSQDQDGSGGGIFAQRYHANGTPDGGEFQVNTTSTGNQQLSSVVLDDQGNEVVIWQGFDSEADRWNVFLQLYDTSGAPRGGETLVARAARYAAVAIGPDSDFAVAWENHDPTGGDPAAVFVQHYDAVGIPQGDVQVLSGDGRGDPSIALGSSGLIMFAGGETTEGSDIFLQTYDVTPPEVTNYPPNLAPIEDYDCADGETLTFTATATDLNPTDTLTFSLAPSSPSGATIDPVTGVFSWTPAAEKMTRTDTVTVRVSDNGSPPMHDIEEFAVTIVGYNSDPVISEIGNIVLYAGAPLHLPLDGFDADGDALEYSVESSNPDVNALVPEGNRSMRVSVAGHGDMEFELFENRVPNTTGRIIELAEAGFYDGETFDEVFPSQWLLAGDDSGETFDDEFHRDLLHTSSGVLSMAGDGLPDNNDSRFHITANPRRNWDFQNTVFGFQTAGKDVLRSIQFAQTDESGKPLEEVVMSSVEVFVDETNGTLMLSAPPGTAGSADITITVTDDFGGLTTQTFLVVIHEDPHSVPPFLSPVADVHTTDGQPVSFNLSSTNRDGDQLIYSAALIEDNSGIAVDVSGSQVTITPETGLTGAFALEVGVASLDGGRRDSQTIALFVEPNGPSTVSLSPDSDSGQSNNDLLTNLNNADGRTLTFHVTDTTPGLELRLLADGQQIGSVVPDATSLLVTTNGTQEIADGVRSITAVTVLPEQTLDIGNRHETFTVTSEPSDALSITVDSTPPAFTSTPIQGAEVGTAYTYDTDTDDELGGLVIYSLAELPEGMTIDPNSGIIQWTPDVSQEGPHRVVVEALDTAGNVGTQEFFIGVGDLPMLVPVDPQTVDEGQTLTVDLTASGGTAPLTISLGEGAPAGAAINPVTGQFTWTPDETQGPGEYDVAIIVTDAAMVSMPGSINITVSEVNQAPQLDSIADQTAVEGELFSLSAAATDTDEPANVLTYSLEPGAPMGMIIDPNSGLLTWTPDESHGSGEYDVTVTVTDDGSPPLNHSTTFYVAVEEANTSPTIATIDDRTIDEGDTLELSAMAADTDDPANTLSFSLDPGAPDGASIDPATGVIAWTTDESHGGGTYEFTVRVTDDGSPPMDAATTFVVTVNEVNQAPQFEVIADQTATEGVPFSLLMAANDSDDPANVLAYVLGDNAPSGVTIDPTSGLLTWTPEESQGSQTYSVTVEVTDDGSPPLGDSVTFSITVEDGNQAPWINPIDDQMVAWGDTLQLTATAGDADVPADGLSFSLTEDAPTGATIDPATGLLTWTPEPNFPVGPHVITVEVTDDGTPAMSAATTFTVTVEEFNEPPALAVIDNQVATAGVPLSFTVSAEDLNDPPESLRYSLVEGAPEGAEIDPVTGEFTWTPPADLAPGWYEIGIRVDDGRLPAKEDATTVMVRVFDTAPESVEDWGSVDLLETASQDVADGSRYFLQPARDGRLTIEALFSQADGDVNLTLLDRQGNVVASSNSEDDNERLDVEVLDGEQYELVIEGDNPAVSLRAANLLVEEDDLLSVHGTDGDDIFELTLGDEHLLTVAGIEYSIDPAATSTIIIDGLSGSDQCTLTGTPDDETLLTSPMAASFGGTGVDVEVLSVATLTVDGGGGNDTAAMYDSDGDDSFMAMPDYARLRGEGFDNLATGFSEAIAYSGEGNDVAQLFDSEGNDSFAATPEFGQLRGDGFLLRAEAFSTVQVQSTYGGNDVAQLYDSPGDDTFMAIPGQGALYGEGYYNQARSFSTVHAHSTAGGSDTALMYDSPGDDSFVASDLQSALYGDGFYNLAKDFDTVHAYSQSGGSDIAQLYDSAGDDFFEADANEATLQGDGFSNRAKGFDEVRAYAQQGGYDTAELYDAGSDDTLDASPDEVTLHGDKLFIRAKLFDAVHAHAIGGGVDTANFHDSSGSETFIGRPGEASLSGGDFFYSAEYFERVYASSSPGGFDEAQLYDSPETDYLEVDAEQASLTDAMSSFLLYLTNYDRITATSESGPDRKTIAPAVDFLLLEGEWLDL